MRKIIFLLMMVLVTMAAKPVSTESLFDFIVRTLVAVGISLNCAICAAMQMLHLGGCG